MAQGRAIAPRIDTDTGAYFTELKQHFDQLKAGSEEQELLVGNALAEAAGQPAVSYIRSSNEVAQVAGQPTCTTDCARDEGYAGVYNTVSEVAGQHTCTTNGFGAGGSVSHAEERVLHFTVACLAWRSDERQLHVGGVLAEAALSLPVVNGCRQAGRAAVPCLWP